MRVTCERCLRRYDVPDATVKGRKIRARCKCGARVVVQDEARAAMTVVPDSQTTGSIQRPVRWFVDITSWEPIAMDLRQLVRAFDAGRIDADTLVWRKGMPDWRRLRDAEELAERLIGAEGTKNGTTEPVAEVAVPRSEPPPQLQQSERSKTPPANYAVGTRRASGHQVGLTAVRGEGNERPTAPPPDEATGTLPGVPKLPSERSTAGSASPPRASARTSKSSALNKSSGRAGASVSRVPFAPTQSRTITQTGLSMPPKAGGRASGGTGLSGSIPLDSDAEKSGRASAPAAAPSSRTSRNLTPPAAGPRRVPSSDETPAQKPSSMSVPPDATGDVSPGPRGKRLVAIAAVVFGMALGVRQWLADPTGETAAPSAARPETSNNGAQIEKRKALVPESTRDPIARSPESAEPPATAPSFEVVPAVGKSTPAVVPQVATAPTSSRQLEVAAPRPVRSPSTPPPPVKAAPPAETPAQPAEDEFGIDEPTAAAAAGVTETSPSGDRAPVVTDEASVAPTPTESTPAGPSAGSPPAGSAPAAPKVLPFNAQVAEQHLGVAAWKASTCSELGPTRGAGQVKVLIETWGRVVRVTHLNQAFVGTPVGLCIMQAFQQVQVPPFEGTPQSVTGSFVIE